MSNYQILELFPTPLLVTTLPNSLSNIVPWFYQQEMLGEEVDSVNFGERSKNSYILDEPECTDIKSYILNLTQEYGNALGYDYENYRFSQSWLSYKHPNQHHAYHTHPNSLISGVFYFGIPDPQTPAIKFHKPEGGINASYISPKTLSNFKELKYAQKEFSINFEPGTLLLFPSFLPHSVPLNKSENTRCSLAFNIVPSLGLGDEGNLTELKF